LCCVFFSPNVSSAGVGFFELSCDVLQSPFELCWDDFQFDLCHIEMIHHLDHDFIAFIYCFNDRGKDVTTFSFDLGIYKYNCHWWKLFK
jgi:hypothetical protein